jgi:hypothetical protein
MMLPVRAAHRYTGVVSKTPPGTPRTEDWVSDPSATFVGKPGTPEDNARLAMLERVMREQTQTQAVAVSQNNRIRPKLEWNASTGEWVSSAPAAAPDPSAVDRLAPQTGGPVPSFDFPDAFGEDEVVAGPRRQGWWASVRRWLRQG